jgi:tetratricopeptide (TPR) repeat protein
MRCCATLFRSFTIAVTAVVGVLAVISLPTLADKAYAEHYFISAPRHGGGHGHNHGGHHSFGISPYGLSYGYHEPGFSIRIGPGYPYRSGYYYGGAPYYYPPNVYNYYDYGQPPAVYYGQTQQSTNQVSRAATPAASVIATNGRAAVYQLGAEQAFRQGRYDNALRLASHAVVEDPDNGKLDLFLSQVLFALGRYHAAVDALRDALTKLDRSQWGYVVENYTRFYRGRDYVTQMEQLVQYSKANPDAAYAILLRGYHYLFLGHTEAARKVLAKAAELDSGDKLTQDLLGMAGGAAVTGVDPHEEVLPEPPSTDGPSSASATTETDVPGASILE